MLALADAMTGRSRRQPNPTVPRRRRSSTRCPTTSSPRHLDAAAWLAGAELYLDRYAEADAHAEPRARGSRARPARESSSSSCSRSSAGSGTCAASWPRPAELLDGGIEAARLLGQHARARLEPLQPLRRRSRRRATSSSRSPPHRRASSSARGLDEGFSLGLGGGAARRRPARNRATGAARSSCSSVAPAARS